eukprot:gene20849-27682_t
MKEDEELRKLVAELGDKKWSAISRELKTKGSKQCRRRWRNFLNAKLKKGGWDTKEDAILLAGHIKFGNRWTEIAKLIGGRTDNAVKNRFAALGKRNGGVIDPALLANLPSLELPTYDKDGSDDDSDEDEMDVAEDFKHGGPSASHQPSATQTAPQTLAQLQNQGQIKRNSHERGEQELSRHASAPHHPQPELASRQSNMSARSLHTHLQAPMGGGGQAMFAASPLHSALPAHMTQGIEGLVSHPSLNNLTPGPSEQGRLLSFLESAHQAKMRDIANSEAQSLAVRRALPTPYLASGFALPTQDPALGCPLSQATVADGCEHSEISGGSFVHLFDEDAASSAQVGGLVFACVVLWFTEFASLPRRVSGKKTKGTAGQDTVHHKVEVPKATAAAPGLPPRPQPMRRSSWKSPPPPSFAATRQGKRPGLSISVPDSTPGLLQSATNLPTNGGLSIRVYRDLLTPSELVLAKELNDMDIPIQTGQLAAKSAGAHRRTPPPPPFSRIPTWTHGFDLGSAREYNHESRAGGSDAKAAQEKSEIKSEGQAKSPGPDRKARVGEVVAYSPGPGSALHHGHRQLLIKLIGVARPPDADVDLGNSFVGFRSPLPLGLGIGEGNMIPSSPFTSGLECMGMPFPSPGQSLYEALASARDNLSDVCMSPRLTRSELQLLMGAIGGEE